MTEFDPESFILHKLYSLFERRGFSRMEMCDDWGGPFTITMYRAYYGGFRFSSYFGGFSVLSDSLTVCVSKDYFAKLSEEEFLQRVDQILKSSLH